MTKKNKRFHQHKSIPPLSFSFPLLCIVLCGGLWMVSSSIRSSSFHFFLSDTLRELSRHPFSHNLHLELAKKLQSTGQNQQMEYEIALTNSLRLSHPLITVTREENILGVNTVEEMNSIAEKNSRLTSYWEEIIETHPKYRDANIQLAILAFNNGESQKTVHYIEKVLALDPNYSFPPEMTAFVAHR